MSRSACFTVDVEHDCPPYLDTWRGLEQGMPRLLDVLAKLGVPATFFCTGESARRYPEVMRRVVAEGHELASHGDRHLRFDRASPAEAWDDLARSVEALSRYRTPTSFRSPYLSLPEAYVELVRRAGFTADSSEARYKRWRVEPRVEGGLVRIPASVTSSVLRLPRPLRDWLLRTTPDPLVLFVHPWELCDFRRSQLRLDCRFRTGDPAEACIRQVLGSLRGRGYSFLRLDALARLVARRHNTWT